MAAKQADGRKTVVVKTAATAKKSVTARKPAATQKTTVARTATAKSATARTGRPVGVPKTYKLYIGGKYPRSESGRSFEVLAADGTFVANASLASRKDLREAVVVARKAFAGWSSATAYLRGQILYRVAEMLDGRRSQFVDELVTLGATGRAAEAEVDAAVATWIYYAGFADKYAQIVGAANPVAAPYFNFSLPEATGVVGIVAPQSTDQSLVGLAATVAPAVMSGNTVVVLASESNPLTAISFAEVLGTSDVPGGVINVLTGKLSELAPVLASHMDVNALDLAGIAADATTELERAAADNLKRVVRPRALDTRGGGDLESITSFTELKTVWHPIGV
ncbi:MAG: aldehyde dehydrogenase family protein [Thermoleophilia bacterium]|nr:aldehyde dehydrogenase family protein [Thermoleophilia bacterium]